MSETDDDTIPNGYLDAFLVIGAALVVFQFPLFDEPFALYPHAVTLLVGTGVVAGTLHVAFLDGVALLDTA
ncbi:MAG: hypothetical protein ABEI75_02920 [Halobaculum sp.]